MDIVREHRHPARLAINSSESALLKIANYYQKMKRDLVGTEEPHKLMNFVSRLAEQSFKKSTIVGNSFTDILNKGSQIRLQAAEVYENMLDSNRYRRHMERGFKHTANMNKLFATGARYFSVDTEYISSDVANEIGIRPGATAAGKVEYEIGGSFFEASPSGPKAIGSVRYVPNIFQTDESGLTPAMQARVKEIREGIKRFQLSHAERTRPEVEKLIKEMRTGSLVVTYKGQTYDLMQGDKLPFVSAKKPGETWDQYYLRVQDGFAKEVNAQYTIGQNWHGSEHGIFEKRYSRVGKSLPGYMNEDNIVDLLDVAFTISPNNHSSRALGNITAAVNGMSEAEMMETQEKIANVLQGTNGRSARKNALQRIKPRNEAESKFINAIIRDIDDLPSNFSLHTADLDAFFTGNYGLHGLYKKLQDPGIQSVHNAMHSIYRSLNKMGERGQMLDLYGGGFYGDDGEDGNAYAFFANQEAAAWGQAGAISPGVLPFHRLQNPVRQLYQRINPGY